MRRSNISVAMLVGAVFYGMAAQGTETARSALGGKRAGLEQCKAGDTDPLSSSGRKPVRPDLGCAMRVSDLRPLLGKADVALVDVRSKQDFDVFHGDGAMNLPMEAVRTKAFLKTQQVILVGNGRAERDLYALCGELKAAGFSRVKMLQGGMLSWAVERLPGIGTSPPPGTLALLSPEELRLAAGFDANAVLVPPAGKDFTMRLPRSIPLIGASPADIRAAVEKARKRNPVAAVVMVTGSEYDVRDYESARSGLGETPLLLYSDSLATYDRYVADQEAIWAAQAKSAKRPGCSF